MLEVTVVVFPGRGFLCVSMIAVTRTEWFAMKETSAAVKTDVLKKERVLDTCKSWALAA